MKRREFAQKYHLTYDTIRHYIDIGLLTPKLKGSHYYFDDDDCNDIETILQFKQLNFSLSEIQKAVTIQRVADKKSPEYHRHLLPLYQSKISEIDTLTNRYREIKKSLVKRAEQLKAQSTPATGADASFGLPLSALALLACPQCRRELNLLEGHLARNTVMQAVLSCGCGYSASIQDGIYVDGRTAKKKLLHNGTGFPTLDEYLQIVSPQYVNFQFTAMSTAVKMINSRIDAPRTMLELNFCIGSFLDKYKHSLHGDTTYILADYDLDRIKQHRKKLFSQSPHRKFVFLCCDLQALPLKPAAVDVVIDDWMPKCYVPSSRQSIAGAVLPLISKNGILVGFYHYIKAEALYKRRLLENVVDYYDKQNLLKMIEALELEVLEHADIGPCNEYNPYNSEVKNIDVYQCVYTARRKSDGTA